VAWLDKKVTFGKEAKDCYIAKLAPKFELYCIVNHRKFHVNCRICYHSWMVNVQEKVI